MYQYLIVGAMAIVGWYGLAGAVIAQEPSSKPAAAEPEAEFGALPLPIQTGARWLRYALLAPLQPCEISSAPELPEAKHAAAAEPARETREIVAIRERLGGSVVRGSVFDSADPAIEKQAEFSQLVEEYRKTQGETWRNGPLLQFPAQPASHRLPVPHSPSQFSQAIAQDPIRAASDHLRASARNLDSAAADLEDAGNYVEADRLRELASQLRQEAREFTTAQVAGKGVTR